MSKEEARYSAREMLVLASWRYAVFFSFSVTTSLSLFAAFWIWMRDGRLHDIDALLVAWVVLNAVLIPAIKWDNGRR